MSDSVIDANSAFYAAHEGRDLAAMQRIWEHSERATCIHPGWPILRTWPVVEESWRRILAGPGRHQFIITNEVLLIEGDLAWITLDENLVDSNRPEAIGGTIACTNAFARNEDGMWRMVLHHGSPVAGAG